MWQRFRTISFTGFFDNFGETFLTFSLWQNFSWTLFNNSFVTFFVEIKNFDRFYFWQKFIWDFFIWSFSENCFYTIFWQIFWTEFSFGRILVTEFVLAKNFLRTFFLEVAFWHKFFKQELFHRFFDRNFFDRTFFTDFVWQNFLSARTMRTHSLVFLSHSL